MLSSHAWRVRACFALFCVAVIFFVMAGPYRALLGSYSYDLAPIYGAAKSWVHGLNPYDMQRVAALAHEAGYDASSYPNYTPIQPSVYLPTCFPLFAPFTVMSWDGSRLLWAGVSTVLFGLSVVFFVPFAAEKGSSTKWLVLAAAFFFSPTALGLSHGNPSVLACSLTMLGVYCALNGHEGWAAVAVGVVHCIKPQISFAAVLLFALWGYWRPLLWSVALPAAATAASIMRAGSVSQFGHWLVSMRQALAVSTIPGGINDPSPTNSWSYSMVNAQTLTSIWLRSPALVNGVVWVAVVGLAVCYLILRARVSGDNRPRDMAFFSALTLLIVYHRFYDEQLLLMTIPFLLTVKTEGKTLVVVLWLLLIALMLPLHAGSDLVVHKLKPGTLAGLVLLRPLPLIVLAMSILLIPWNAVPATQETSAHSAVAKSRVNEH